MTLSRNADVVFVVKSFFNGGAERNISDLAIELSNRNKYVDVLILGDGASENFDRLISAGVNVVVVGSKGVVSMVVQAFRHLKVAPGSVVHAHMPMAIQVCRVVGLFRRMCLVTTEHNVWHRIHPLHRFVYGFLVGRDAKSLACSKAVADSFPFSLEVNENGRDFNELVADSTPSIGLPNGLRKDRDFIILNVANVNKKKDQSLLVRSFSQLPIRIDRRISHLLIAGAPGDAWDALRNEVAALGLEDRVHFLGARGDVGDLMRAADVFVLTSKFEGLPLVVLEAMYLGLPVVATEVGELGRLLNDSPWLVKSRDPNDIADAIMNSVEPFAREKMVEVAADRVRSQYTIDRQVDELLNIYKNIGGICGKRRDN